MTVHMVQMRLDALALMRLARRRRLPRRKVDLGYLTHCQLGETFGDEAPAPFAVAPGGARSNDGGMRRDPLAYPDRQIPILAYSTLDAAGLRERAQEAALPEAYSGVEWSSVKSKPMPESWSAGRRLRFEIRACPVVRMASSGPQHRKGAEVDVFLRECWRAGADTKVERQAVYREWLTDHLERRGARAAEVSIRSLRLLDAVRRDHAKQRKSHTVRRPDVLFEGVLEVADADSFERALHRGIGRHRAFGFGMLLVKPA
jgi:CRISPR system Cascade subunit CasE